MCSKKDEIIENLKSKINQFEHEKTELLIISEKPQKLLSMVIV